LVAANRAVAVAMAEGPVAGLVILRAVSNHPQLARWPQLHIAWAELLRRLHRHADARDAYRAALDLEPAAVERAFITRRMSQLTR
jgi:RNA polymerase sigma-70 factor, ECF subfamily